MTSQFALTCVYCQMGWTVTNGFEVNRIIDQHEDVCEAPGDIA